MKNLILFLALILFFANLQGQNFGVNKDGSKEKFVRDTSEACDKDFVFTITEDMPNYLGGEEKLEEELNQNLTFEKDVNKMFLLHFTINCEGKLFGIKAPNNKYDNLILKVMNEIVRLQNWESATQRGEHVDCFYGLRVKVKRGKLKFK